MLGKDFGVRAFEWTSTAEPFVDDNPEGILIAGKTCLSLNLFWSHVGNRAKWNLRAHGRGAMGSSNDAKITEQDIVALSDKHIFRLDIAVNELVIVGILQSLSNLMNVGDYGRERDTLSFGVTLPKGAMRTIVHYQK